MGKLKGQTEYNKFLKGEKLTVKKAIMAHCFVCNGEDEGSYEDCVGLSCPLYPFFKKWVYRDTKKPQKSFLQAEKGSWLLDRTNRIRGSKMKQEMGLLNKTGDFFMSKTGRRYNKSAPCGLMVIPSISKVLSYAL